MDLPGATEGLCLLSWWQEMFLGNILIDLTEQISCFILHQNAPLSDLGLKGFSAIPLPKTSIILKVSPQFQQPTIFLLRVNFFGPRYTPGNRLCKNAPKTVEATNILSLFKVFN